MLMKAMPITNEPIPFIFSSAKIIQAERNQACLELLRRNLSYAKVYFYYHIDKKYLNYYIKTTQ